MQPRVGTKGRHPGLEKWGIGGVEERGSGVRKTGSGVRKMGWGVRKAGSGVRKKRRVLEQRVQGSKKGLPIPY